MPRDPHDKSRTASAPRRRARRDRNLRCFPRLSWLQRAGQQPKSFTMGLCITSAPRSAHGAHQSSETNTGDVRRRNPTVVPSAVRVRLALQGLLQRRAVDVLRVLQPQRLHQVRRRLRRPDTRFNCSPDVTAASSRPGRSQSQLLHIWASSADLQFSRSSGRAAWYGKRAPRTSLTPSTPSPTINTLPSSHAGAPSPAENPGTPLRPALVRTVFHSVDVWVVLSLTWQEQVGLRCTYERVR